MKIFLVTLIFIIAQNVFAQALPPAKIGSYFYKVDPHGTAVVPITGAPIGTGAPRTRVDLTDIDPNLNLSNSAGLMIRVQRVGAYSNSPNGVETGHYLELTFIDEFGNFIIYGPKTHAVTPVGPVIMWSPFSLGLDGTNGTADVVQIFDVEIPAGARSILFNIALDVNDAAHCCFDYNGDLGVMITYPIVSSVDVYQVVKNFSLTSFFTSDAIDLVAGKNADIVAKIGPLINFDGSYIEWKSGSSSSDVTKVFNNSSLTSDVFGNAIFHIDPVPKDIHFQDKITKPVLHLKIHDSTGAVVNDFTQEIHSTVRKTNPIKLGYIPITGCGKENECFKKPAASAATVLSLVGGDFVRAMYPVAEDEFIYTEALPSQALAENNFNKRGVQIDLNYLQKEILEDKLVIKGFTGLIGVVNQEYFSEFHKTDYKTVVGIAPRILRTTEYENTTAIVTEEYNLVLPHEIGHTFSLEHSDASTAGGYLNTNLTTWNINRGPLLSQLNFMAFDSGYYGTTSKYWITDEEYRVLFLKNMKIKSQNLDYGLHVSASVDALGKVEILNTYIFQNFTENNNPFETYYYQAVDSDHNVLYSHSVNPEYLSEPASSDSTLTSISFNVPYFPKAIFINIFKNDKFKSTNLVSTISIPSEILMEEVKFIPDLAIIGNAVNFKNQLTTLINDYREKIINYDFSAAQVIISSSIIPFINKNMTDNFIPNSTLDIGKNEFNKLLTTSLLKIMQITLNDTTTSNPFLEIKEVNSPLINERSKIELTQIKQPTNVNQQFVHKVWFDGLEVKTSVIGNKITAESTRLNIGIHTWSIKTFMVNSQIKKSSDDSIRFYQNEISNLNNMYLSETDPDKKQVLFVKIQNDQQRIQYLSSLISDQMIQLGKTLITNVEVR